MDKLKQYNVDVKKKALLHIKHHPQSDKHLGQHSPYICQEIKNF